MPKRRNNAVMNWKNTIPLTIILVCWTVFFTGVTDVPPWQGFAKGLAIGSLAGLWPAVTEVGNWISALSRWLSA
jgi:hypothetical protein